MADFVSTPKPLNLTDILESDRGIYGIQHTLTSGTIIIMKGFQTIYNLKIQSNVYTPCGLQKCALRVELVKKSDGAAMSGKMVMLFNKPAFRGKKTNIPNFDILREASQSKYTPTLYFSTVSATTDNYIMILEDVMSGENDSDMCKKKLNSEQQLDLLTAFVRLGELGLELVDPNCGNIILNGDKVKIIDDISKIVDDADNIVEAPSARLYYAMTRLSKLQFNDNESTLLQFAMNLSRLSILEFNTNYATGDIIIKKFKSDNNIVGGKKKRINKTRRKRRYTQKRRR